MKMEKNSENLKGNAFEKITRERVDNFIKMFDDFKNNDFQSLVKEVKRIGNRPSWAVSTIVWVLSSALTGLLVRTIILG